MEKFEDKIKFITHGSMIPNIHVSCDREYPGRKVSNLTGQNYVNSIKNFKYWPDLSLNLLTTKKAKETMKMIFLLL